MVERSSSERRLVYLARHGETEWNRVGRWQGHTDIPLTDLGRDQARALAVRLRDAAIEHVIASDLVRARDTARIVATALGIAQVTEDVDLRERMFGCFEGLTRAQCENERADEWRRYRADPRSGPPGAETHSAVLERMHRAVARAALLPGRAPVLLITHGSAMRILGNGLGQVGTDPIHNGELFRVEVEAGLVRTVGRVNDSYAIA